MEPKTYVTDNCGSWTGPFADRAAALAGHKDGDDAYAVSAFSRMAARQIWAALTPREREDRRLISDPLLDLLADTAEQEVGSGADPRRAQGWTDQEIAIEDAHTDKRAEIAEIRRRIDQGQQMLAGLYGDIAARYFELGQLQQQRRQPQA